MLDSLTLNLGFWRIHWSRMRLRGLTIAVVIRQPNGSRTVAENATIIALANQGATALNEADTLLQLLKHGGTFDPSRIGADALILGHLITEVQHGMLTSITLDFQVRRGAGVVHADTIRRKVTPGNVIETYRYLASQVVRAIKPVAKTG